VTSHNTFFQLLKLKTTAKTIKKRMWS
jgi:hypothetical protein